MGRTIASPMAETWLPFEASEYEAIYRRLLGGESSGTTALAAFPA